MELYFFDSYGVYPPKEIENLMFRLKEQGKERKKTIKLYYQDLEKGNIGIHFDTIIKK